MNRQTCRDCVKGTCQKIGCDGGARSKLKCYCGGVEHPAFRCPQPIQYRAIRLKLEAVSCG